MNDKNIFIGVCEDNSLHLNLVKGYIDDFFMNLITMKF